MRLLSQRLDHDERRAARQDPRPSDAQIRDALTGLKCRCGTHVSILRRRQARGAA